MLVIVDEKILNELNSTISELNAKLAKANKKKNKWKTKYKKLMQDCINLRDSLSK